MRRLGWLALLTGAIEETGLVLPRLLHPIDVVISRITKGTTIYDDDTREPISQPDRADNITIKGQVKWREQYALSPKKGGVEENSLGYVLLRKYDMDELSFTIARGDQIAKIGNIDTDVYVTKLEWCGHYSDQGGATMVKAHFEDRQPSRQTRGE